MVDIDQWMKEYQSAVRNLFGSRILFIGLQGSYGRGEAHENSDIDVVLILDAVSLTDLKKYQHMIEMLSDGVQICGFVSGKEELAGWSKVDLFQFYYDTVSYYGSLNSMISVPTGTDARRAVRIGACNLYHMCSHNYLYRSDMGILKDLYKSALFVLQAKHFAETGDYVKSHVALKRILTGMDLSILQVAEQLENGDTPQAALARDSDLMLQWTHRLICDDSTESLRNS